MIASHRTRRRSQQQRQAGAGGRVRGWFVGEEPDFRTRGLWLILAFAAMALILTIRLVDVQIHQGPALSAMAASNHESSVKVRAQRGRIYDRTGRLLAGDVTVYDVFADPGMIPPSNRHAVALQLSPVLQQGPGRIEGLISQPGHFVYLSKRVGDTVRQRIDDLGLAGVGTIPEQQRVYTPSGVAGTSFAANLLGFVDHDGQGQYGVEGYYDRVLRGEDGVQSTLRDAAGNPIVLSRQDQVTAHNGDDLRLGLDSNIQFWAEQALARGVQDSKSASGSILIMDTHTGAIRAWADYPTYDGNSYASTDVGLFRDDNVANLYEPGSVMKVVTFAGALDHHAITPDQVINEGPVRIDGYTIGDWDGHAHGHVTMQWVLDDSLNDGAIRVQQFEGQDAFYQNLLNFGIGAPTGVDLAGEVNQPLAPQSEWKGVDYATSSFGQHVEVTPLEMLAAINAVGNGGVWVQPHAVEAVVDATTGHETPFAPATRRVIAPDTAALLSHMMTGVVEDRGASGFMVKMPSFKGLIAGKTGTASVPVNGRYAGDVIVSFAGFMPVTNPQFTMLVVLRLPKENKVAREGAFLAAPIWKQLAQLMIDTWKIVP